MFFLFQGRYPENFVLISQLEVCQEGGVKKEGTWMMLWFPDQRHGGDSCSWHHEWCFLTKGRYPENLVLISQLEEGQEEGVKKGGAWRTLRVPDGRHGGLGHSWRHEWCFFTPRKIHWKFCVDISIGSVSGRGGQEGGYLEYVVGSWLEAWMSGSLPTSWVMFFYPKKNTMKILCWYLN